jgi:predicted nicotinamide N-methyase
MNALPPLPRTPMEAITDLVRERVILGETTFLIDRPDDSDGLINHPAIRAAFAADEYLPYWADLWPAARMLAKAVLAEPWQPGTVCLEIGCGHGLPGVAALSRGLHVIFNDYDATAVEFAASNARLNGFTDFEERPFDWRDPPADLTVPVVLGSDLIYELRNVEPLVGVLTRVLRPGGLCLLSDQDRKPTQALREALSAAGWSYTSQMMRAGAPGGLRVKGTLYRVTRPVKNSECRVPGSDC